MLKIKTFLILFLYIPVIWGCSTGGLSGAVITEGKAKVLDVPFFPQKKYQCGEATLSSVLNYWGEYITPEQLSSELFNPALKGTLGVDLLLYARRSGYNAILYRGSLEDLRRRIDRGEPLIIMVDYGVGPLQKNHFMVVVGYNRDGVFVHSGTERNLFINNYNLLRIWRRTGYWTLLITRE